MYSEEPAAADQLLVYTRWRKINLITFDMYMADIDVKLMTMEHVFLIGSVIFGKIVDN